MNKNTGNVYWLTGLSGSGKTTLASELKIKLEQLGRVVLFLDGDQLRADLEQNDYSYEGRLKLAFCYGRLCRRFATQGFDVICATVSLFSEIQNWNKLNIPNYIEIFLDVPLDILKSRDSKLIYSNAKNTKYLNTVGIDIQPNFPNNPDCIIKNYGDNLIDDSIQKILSIVEKKNLNKNKDIYVSS